MSFFKSFKYAFRGILYCIKNERNMRFHTVTALYVLIFARFFNFSRGELLLLILTIASVLSAEAMNTSIEKTDDKLTKEYDEKIRRSKDSAAASVLIIAISSVVIGVVLFSSAEGWTNLWNFYITHPVNLGALLFFTALAPVYVFIGPMKVFQFFLRKRRKVKNKKRK